MKQRTFLRMAEVQSNQPASHLAMPACAEMTETICFGGRSSRQDAQTLQPRHKLLVPLHGLRRIQAGATLLVEVEPHAQEVDVVLLRRREQGLESARS